MKPRGPLVPAFAQQLLTRVSLPIGSCLIRIGFLFYLPLLSKAELLSLFYSAFRSNPMSNRVAHFSIMCRIPFLKLNSICRTFQISAAAVLANFEVDCLLT